MKLANTPKLIANKRRMGDVIVFRESSKTFKGLVNTSQEFVLCILPIVTPNEMRKLNIMIM